jgi:hypothetical protein
VVYGSSYRLQAGFLTCVLPQGPSRQIIIFIFIENYHPTVDFPFRIFDYQSNQTLTAAGPSRFLTVFPFSYPGLFGQDLQSVYSIFKEHHSFYHRLSNPATKK